MNNRCILITCCWSLVSSHSFFCRQPEAWRYRAMNNRCILITCCRSLVSSRSFFCRQPEAWRYRAMNNRCILITCCWSLIASHSFFCRQPEAWRYRAINGWIQGIVNISGATRTSTLSRSLNLQRQRSGIGESCYDS